MPVSAIAVYAITLVIAFVGAVAHPWFDAETHFVRALTAVTKATAALVVPDPRPARP